MITLAFSAYRILMTSIWLQEHREYIMARDAKWDPFLKSIEDHLVRQDEMVTQVEANQAEIMKALSKPAR